MLELRQQVASSGTELCAKFAADANFVLEYGSVGDFYSGLEGLLGPPAVRVLEGIEFEHCGLHDADLFFTTSNGMHTTSRDEFEFVVRPQLGKAYPERRDVYQRPGLARRPLPPEAFASVREQILKPSATGAVIARAARQWGGRMACVRRSDQCAARVSCA